MRIKSPIFKKALYGILVAISVFLFFTLVLPISFIPYDNYKFNYFSWQLWGNPNPPKSEVLEKTRDFGSLVGNGDHCDFFAALLVKSGVDEIQLRQYYQSYIQATDPIEPMAELFKVSDFKEVNIVSSDPVLPVQRYAEEVVGRYSKSELEDLYIIYIFAPDYVSGIGDLRCG